MNIDAKAVAKKIGYAYSNNPQCEADIAAALLAARNEAYAEGYKACHEDTKAHPGYLIISDTGNVTGVLPPEVRIAVRNEALEEAAKVAESRGDQWGDKWEDAPDAKALSPLARMREGHAIAERIRALKEGT